MSTPATIIRILIAEGGPLALFFASFLLWGLYVATAVFMVAMALSAGSTYAAKGRLPTFPMIGLAMVLLFGGLTLWLGEAAFIKIKPTVTNGLFGAAILGGLAVGTNLVKRALGDELTMRDSAWQMLALRGGVFLLAQAALNEWVRLSFSTETWVWFKLCVTLPLNIAFAAAQWPLIRRERRAAMHALNRARDADRARSADSRAPEGVR